MNRRFIDFEALEKIPKKKREKIAIFLKRGIPVIVSGPHSKEISEGFRRNGHFVFDKQECVRVRL
ncbi:hypothetical protein HCJ39_13335 [Listeria rocourtiae]|uniref:hypothetical protein n=1 Tax=Listeria rocourtiae TaxID=647910 RepID=UPI00162784DB|nr:hypothetical protein [Listeria rocourtiae]MBC1605698.1 hypothetical protein [Listeria rocourtiae]